MATLKLKSKPAPRASDRPPVRNAKPRPTLTQAQAERERRKREAEQRRGDAPALGEARPARGPRRDDDDARPPRGPRPDDAQRPARSSPRRDDDRPAAARPPRRDDERPAPRGPRRDDAARPAARGPRRDDERPARPPRPREDDDRQGRPARAGAPRPRPEAGARPQEERRPRPPAARPPQGAAPSRESLHPSAPPTQRSPGPKPAPKQPAGSGERLSKRLGEMGLASRREADDWIDAGWVRVNGKMAVLGQRVTPDDKIDIDPAARQQQAKQVTILLHKPIGYVSGQAEDGHEPAWVLVKPENRWEDDPSGIKHHAGHLRHLAPAGRLDIDSTGLLVLTQDGRVAKTLIGDDSLIEKEYLVRIEYLNEGPVPESAIALLNHGLELDGVQLKPAKVSWQNEEQLRFVLREGRKRQIRRMCEAVGLKVLALKRVRIGRIPLAGLPVGQWRYLGPFEKF